MNARPCPLCKAGLVKHCAKSSTCCWHRCPKCGVTFDLAARRGFDKDNKPVTWAA